jgi:hypothetical protein
VKTVVCEERDHGKCIHTKASEIKHVNFIVDILVYDELKNVVQNQLLLRKLKVPLPKIRPLF